MLEEVERLIEQHLQEMIDIRRYLHQHPELSFQEYETAKYISRFYQNLQIPVKTNVGGNGVIATLKGKLPGKTVAFRADFDALPIQDEKDVPYKSKVRGVMHACAHDAHTATLLIIAKIMQQFEERLPGKIVFLHQHAEEMTPGGAISIVESGVLKDIDVIFGNHYWATMPVGTIATKPGVFMAGADRFTITIRGEGGHGAYPDETKDALLIGAEIVNKLQTIVSRKINPIDTGVLTIGQFDAGSAFNIIAGEATMHGTIRYLNDDVKQKMKEELQRIVKGICIANDVSYDIEYIDGYPPVINHCDETDIVFAAAEQIKEVNDVRHSPVQMGSEDFAYYLQEKPGAFFFTGANKRGQDYPHHHPLFDIDEQAMVIAAKLFIRAFFAYQNKFSS